MLKNAYLDAKIGVDPDENEPRKESWVVARAGVSILRADRALRRCRADASRAAYARASEGAVAAAI